MVRTARHQRRVVAVVVGATAGTAVLVALVLIALRTWTPFNDDAVIWLHVNDVGTRDTPLTGLYSRFGWEHPGPMVFFLLATPFHLLDGRPSALLVGALLIALAAAAAAVGAAARAGGWGAAVPVGVVTIVVAHSLGEGLIDPWTPYTVVLPMLAFVCALWMWIGGGRVALPGAAAFGTFLVQTHVSLVVPVALIGLAAVAWRCIERAPPAPTWRRPPWATMAVLTILWAPPLLQQWFGERGNLSALWSYFTATRDDTTGLADGLGRSARALSPVGPWIGRTTEDFLARVPSMPVGALVVPVLFLGAAGLLSWRWRDRITARLVGLVAVGQVATVLAMARIEGIPFAYLTYWSRSIAGLTVAVPLVAIGRQLAARSHLRSTDRPIAAVLVCIGVAAVALVGVTRPSPTDELGRRDRALVDDAPGTVPEGTTVRVTSAGESLTSSAPTLVVAFEEQGRRALFAPVPAVSGAWFDVAGEARRAPGEAVLPTFVLASGSAVELYAARPGAEIVSMYDPLSAPERRELEALTDSLREQARASGRADLAARIGEPGALSGTNFEGLDADDVARHLELTGWGQQMAVVKLPPTTWPLPEPS